MITIADSGPGIPIDDREHVLERFVRLDETRSTPGNGLGLSLVNAVASLHGATLSLDDNQPGLRVSLDFSMLKEQKKETGKKSSGSKSKTGDLAIAPSTTKEAPSAALKL